MTSQSIRRRTWPCWPGIVGRSLAMPDIHQGYGFPIGGVAATDAAEDGVISPGGVGFDINCGVRLLASSLPVDEVRPRTQELINQLFRDVPSGAGRGGHVKVGDNDDLDRLLVRGANWMVEHGYGEGDDVERCEENRRHRRRGPGLREPSRQEARTPAGRHARVG